MPYSEKLEKRIDRVTEKWNGLKKKKMFGGICYLLKGNMCFGVYKDYLIVRLGADRAAEKLRGKHASPFDITGRPMKGWVMVTPGGWDRADRMKQWLDNGREFALSLPPK